jgi:hypothetical protein
MGTFTYFKMGSSPSPVERFCPVMFHPTFSALRPYTPQAYKYVSPLCLDVWAGGAFRLAARAGFEDGFCDCDIGWGGNFDVG